MNTLATLRYNITTLCLFYCLFISAGSSPQKALLLNPTRAQVDSILCVLDNVIADKKEYQRLRVEHADSLVETASRKQGQERIKAFKDAFAYYSHVSGKKSLDILNKMEALPEYPNDPNLQLWIVDSRGYIYSVMGMFHRSYALLHDIKSVEGYDRPTRMYHYDTVCKVLHWAGEAFCKGDALRTDEKDMVQAYGDSLLLYNNDAMSLAFTSIYRAIGEKKYDDALAKIVALYPETSGQEETYIYAQLCDVFDGRKDTLALEYYFAKTSICDIMAGTTEYMCLPMLVQHLFKDGDIDRAYNYLRCCIDDAYLYPSQYLISQTTNIFPIIDKAYEQQQRGLDDSHHNMMILGFCAILLLFVMLGLSVFLHHRKVMMQELENANEQLHKTNDDLERAINVKNTFLRNMTHELHTPMNAIDGFAQVLDFSEGQLDETSLKEMTSAIRNSSHQLNMLIDNIIMLSQYENSNVQAHMGRVSVKGVFNELRQIVFNTKAGNVDIIYQDNTPDDFTFVSSEIHIVTIINNLIDNALKFTEKGKVVISADMSTAGVADDSCNKVFFRVSDTGMGIPEDRIDTIFDRFTQGDEFAQGVGLGLPLCKTLTMMLNGTIKVEKSDHNGTAIIITLPIQDK